MKLDEAIVHARQIASGVFPWDKPFAYNQLENDVIVALLEEVDRLESTLNARTPAATDVEPRDPEGPLTEREALDWLVFRVIDGAVVSEGELARALGLDRISVRERADEGAAIDERIRAARLARVRKEVSETPT